MVPPTPNSKDSNPSSTGKDTYVDALPKEVLAKIFGYLFLNAEHHNAVRASKDWGRIIEDYLGIALVVGTENQEYFVEYPKVPLDRQMIMATYAWITVSYYDRTTEAIEVSKSTYPQIKNPKTLTKLVLLGNIDQICFRKVTAPLQNLVGLYLHITVFENNIFSVNEKVDLPNLKYLVLDDTAITLTTADFNVNEIYDSATTFLKTSSFRSLERLGIEFPLNEAREAPFTSGIVEFLQKHADTLKALTVHQKYAIETNEEDEDGRDSRDSDDNDGVSIKMLSRNAQKLKNVKLEEICVSLFDSQESSPLWKNFLSHQETLKKLFYINYQIPFPGSLIQKNISTLKVLVVNIKTSVDFASLMGDKCQIRSLVLIGKNSSEPEIDIPKARNLNLLPNSVITLKLSGVTAFSKDIDIVALKKPNLQELVLEDAGTKYQLGMTLETYGYLLDKKQLRCFRIKNSFNTASFSDFSRIPKNVEGLSTVFSNSKRGLTVKGSLDTHIGRYILDGTQEVNTDLEGEGSDVFNLLSGIVDITNQLHSSDNESFESDTRSHTSHSTTEESHSGRGTDESHSDHGTEGYNSSSDSDTGSGGDGDGAEDDTESDSDIEETFDDN